MRPLRRLAIDLELFDDNVWLPDRTVYMHKMHAIKLGLLNAPNW